MKSKMADNTPVMPVRTVSNSAVFWSSSLDLLPKIGMKDVEAFVNLEKSPKSGLAKGYKFFVEGFVHEFQGLRNMHPFFPFAVLVVLEPVN